MTELSQIPNVGKQTERDLLAMGYTSIESLKGKRTQKQRANRLLLTNFAMRKRL